MKTTIRFALISTFALYLLIFTGGLVRVSGAGLGCPDWPRCFGRWIPPVSLSQLPDNVDPAAFNLTLAWIEYLNRAFGILVGILIAVTAILTIKYFGKFLRVALPMVSAALLTALAGWQGGQVVESGLAPYSISAHMILALLIANLMIYSSQQAGYLMDSGPERSAVYPQKIGSVLGWLWLITLAQVILGSRVRGMLEIVQTQYPLLPLADLMGHLGSLEIFHFVAGLAVALASFYLGLTVLQKGRQHSQLVYQCALGLMILAVGQVALGMVMYIAGPIPLAELLHLWLAAIITGVLLMFYSAVKLAANGRMQS